MWFVCLKSIGTKQPKTAGFSIYMVANSFNCSSHAGKLKRCLSVMYSHWEAFAGGLTTVELETSLLYQTEAQGQWIDQFTWGSVIFQPAWWHPMLTWRGSRDARNLLYNPCPSCWKFSHPNMSPIVTTLQRACERDAKILLFSYFCLCHPLSCWDFAVNISQPLVIIDTIIWIVF